MNNLLNRNEFLDSNNVNEGVVLDTIKKGAKKIKDFFSLGLKKIKNIITYFDAKGHVLPVVSLQASADYITSHNIDGVNIYVSDSINDDIKNAGGSPAPTTAEPVKQTADSDPEGREWGKWVATQQFKNTNEYKNLMALPGILSEAYGCSMTEAEKEAMRIFEGTEQDRVFYSTEHGSLRNRTTGVDKFGTISKESFVEKLNSRIKYFVTGETKGKVDSEDSNKKYSAPGNILVFGAPGIGKSTIPDLVVNKFNETKSNNADKIALITINCSNINPGDFMMPSMPRNKDIIGYIQNNIDAFPELSKFSDMMKDDDKKKSFGNRIEASGQTVAPESPKSWLPCYHRTGDRVLDKILDIAANGGTQTVVKRVFDSEYADMFGGDNAEDMKKNGWEETIHETTGSGGIILFDEFLRSDPSIFNELMTFLLNRHFGDWYLGSKWFIVACSNRPCDDGTCDDTWKQISDAGMDRWVEIAHMEPVKEDWIAWAKGKGMEEPILRFIFDESATDEGKEYHRWHRMKGKSGANDKNRSLVVTPRRWEYAWAAICNYEIENDIHSIYDIPSGDLKDILKTIFDSEFLAEFTDWIEQHASEVDLDEIIKNPDTYPAPRGAHDEPVIVVNTITEKFIQKYAEEGDAPDEEIANILIWLGKNYPKQYAVVDANFIQKIDKEVLAKNPRDKSHDIGKKRLTNIVLFAAWPEADTEEVFNDEEYKDKLNDFYGGWEKFRDEAIEYMKKYFPWRIKGDKIQFVDDEND